MKYDFTNETVKAKLHDAFNQLYLKLNEISCVFVTTDISCADIRFKWVLDELTAFKATETFDILKAFFGYRCDHGYGPTFMDAFSDEMFTALKAEPKKFKDVINVSKHLNSSASIARFMLYEI